MRRDLHLASISKDISDDANPKVWCNSSISNISKFCIFLRNVHLSILTQKTKQATDEDISTLSTSGYYPEEEEKKRLGKEVSSELQSDFSEDVSWNVSIEK